jgi:hypothetical protein
MSSESSRLRAEALLLSNSAILSSLLTLLVDKGVLSVDEEQNILTTALELIDESAGEDEDGTYELARELIEQQLA